MILIDSSAWIEFLNRTGRPADMGVERLLRSNADVALARISVTEILQGIRNDREFRKIRDLLTGFPVLDLKGPDSYVAAAELYRACRRKGLTIRSTVDLLIARTAIEHQAVLLHNDRDFVAIAQVADLKILNPDSLPKE